MRVTHVITRLVIGGAQQNTLATIAGLRQKPGVEVGLISGPTTGPEGSLEDVARKVAARLDIVLELVRPVHPLSDFTALRKLERLLRETRPDIVHTHSGKAGILGRIAARRAGVPNIIHHIHGPSFGDFQSAPANWIFTAAEKYAARVTDHFFCSAQAMARLYLAAGIGNPSMYTRIFSGFDLSPFLTATRDADLRARLGFDSGHFVIGNIGRLFRLKGQADLIKAFAAVVPQVPHARLLLVGDGVLRKELEALTASLKLTGKVIFAGLVPPEEVPKYVGIMDCLAHLSYREALSRALPQALAAGKPAVAYNFDGADEICLENETGFLVSKGDIAGAARKLVVLATDENLRQRLGATGQAFVKQNFSIEKMINDQYDVYLRLAEPERLSQKVLNHR